MKKSVKWLLLLILIVIPIKVRALTGSISVSCNPTTLSSNKVSICTLTGTVNDGSIDSLEAKIALSSNLQLNDFTTASVWEGDGIDGIGLYTDTNKTGTFAIGTFTVKAKANIAKDLTENITINDVVFYNSDSSTSATIADGTTTIKVTKTASSSQEQNPKTGINLIYIIFLLLITFIGGSSLVIKKPRGYYLK